MADSEPPAPGWERVAHHTHLYVLPAAGAASLALGGLAVAGIGSEISPILPIALLAAGASSLVGSSASYLCMPRSPKTERLDATPSPAFSPPEASTRPPVPESRRAAHPASHLRPHSGIGRASLAELAHIEDELWKRWASPPSVSLGATLVGPVSETAYSPSRAGAYAPYADRDRDIVVLPGSSGATRADISISPARASPTLSPQEAMTPRGFAGLASPLVSGRTGELFDMDSLDHPAYLASINPILPRLKDSDLEGRKAAGRSQNLTNSRAATRGGICSECSRRLLDFRAWVQCRACRKPLCRECLQESFATEDGGSCSDCRTSHKWFANGHRSHRRAEAQTARWLHVHS